MAGFDQLMGSNNTRSGLAIQIYAEDQKLRVIQ